MLPDPEQRRRALTAFMAAHSLRPYPWCLASGVAEATLRGFREGRWDSMSDRTYAKLAAGATELCFEKRQGRPVTAAELRGETMPAQSKIESYVGAGAEVRPIDGDSLDDWAEAPPFDGPLRAAIVRGESALPMFEDGNVLFYPQPSKALVPFVGDVVIAQLKDGRRLVKRLERGQKEGRWHLLSINPASPMIANVAVSAVAPIVWVKRR